MNWTTIAERKRRATARLERYAGPAHGTCVQRQSDRNRRVNRIEKEFGCGIAELLLGFAAVDHTFLTTAALIRCPVIALQSIIDEQGIIIDWPTDEEEEAAEKQRVTPHYIIGEAPAPRRRPEKTASQVARRLAYEKERDSC